MRVLFANIGWMTHYRGNSTTDKIVGGGSFRNDDKHEAYNFLPIKGKCYGYVQPVQCGDINLYRIDKECTDKNALKEVLVIWIAKHPSAGGTYIVGWYKNAKVYRTFQESNASERKKYDYNIIANKDDCNLIPVDQRTFLVPRARAKGKGFLGQSNVWYCDSNNSDVQQFRKEVLNYIKTFSSEKKRFSKQTLKVDVDAKKRVEKAAVAFVTKEYVNLGYKVDSCEDQNIGWDLNAEKNGIRLKLEVKGLAGSQVSVHISMNEYKAMMSNKDNYRLCVVTNAIKKPTLIKFIWDDISNTWVSDADPDTRLTIELRPSYLAFIE